MSLAAFLDSLATCNTVKLAATQTDEHLLQFPRLWDCKADWGSGRKSRVQSAPSDRLTLLFVFIKSFWFLHTRLLPPGTEWRRTWSMGGFPVTAVGDRAVLDGPGAGKRLCMSPAARGWLQNPMSDPGSWEHLIAPARVCSSPGHAWSLTAVVLWPGIEGPFLTRDQIWGKGPWLQQDLRNAAGT